jgi:hypothetical protein
MPHRIDIDSIHEDAFLLLNLCYAGKEFSQKHKLNPSDDTRGVGYAYYFGWLKFQLSEKLIACAVKTRITLDFLKDEDSDVDLVGEDREICNRHHIGRLEGDSVTLSVREVRNKVIHADSVSPDSEAYDGECERWNGWLSLHGAKGSTEWHLYLDLAAFCLALDELIVFLEESYDWHRVYKYD